MAKTELINLKGTEYTVELIPGNRKSISIRLVTPVLIELKYPSWYGKRRAVDSLVQKESWIKKRSRILAAAHEAGVGSGLYEGRILYYLGREYRVTVKGNEVAVNEDVIFLPDMNTEEGLVLWYRDRTVEAVGDFVDEYNDLIPACTIKVKKQKTIWGSCNRKRRIYINSRLSMCPVEVIHYVLWHEISHLFHMNHSKEFYRVLGKYCPDYKTHKKWLKDHGHLLKI